jgi:hypothetical protein
LSLEIWSQSDSRNKYNIVFVDMKSEW